MNIGFFNAYPFRPHAHQAKFLEGLTKQLGYRSFAINCDGIAQHCYLRELQDSSKLACFKCIAGGLRTFKFDHHDSVRSYVSKKNSSVNFEEKYENMVQSSAYTLARIESFEQRNSEVVNQLTKKLVPSTIRFYHALLKWIEHRQLNSVFVFNGRMDLTRAATEACITAGIPFITHERPLFGNGLILNRNSNCSSLKKIHQINRDFSCKSLTQEQCKLATKLAAERLTGGNRLEWKRYNENSTRATFWPTKTRGPKVLVCPSSKNELLGHPDWQTEWKDNTDALDLAVDNNWFSYSDLLVRFHPAWNVKFGRVSGELCEQHYFNWCKSRGVSFIESSEDISTQDMIRLCDLVIVNGSNTVFEAGALGKPVICLGSSPYTYSGISTDVLSIDQFQSVNIEDLLNRSSDEVIASTLRYFYSKASREPLYTKNVRSKTVTDCTFRLGANPKLLDALLKKDAHLVEDQSFSKIVDFESDAIDALKKDDNKILLALASYDDYGEQQKDLQNSRRVPFGIIDKVRNLFPKGV